MGLLEACLGREALPHFPTETFLNGHGHNANLRGRKPFKHCFFRHQTGLEKILDEGVVKNGIFMS